MSPLHLKPVGRLCRCLCAATSCLTLGISGAARGDVVFDDTFDVGAPPTRGNEAADSLDVQWYKNASTALTVVDDTGGIGTGNALNADNTGVGFGGFGKFAANFPTVSLDEVGDAATLSFDFRRLTSGTPSGSGPTFRFGLYDNGGTALTGDSGGTNVLSNTANDVGYFISLNVGRPGAGATREGPESQGILGGPVGADQLNLTNVLGNPFAGLNDADPHEILLMLTRVAAGVKIQVSVDGTTVIDATDEGIDPDTNMPAGLFVTDFDVIGFGIGSNDVAYDYRLDNIRLVAAPLMGLPGDFNGDGSVDAADYVAWRTSDGTQEGYDLWRANFGQTASVSGAGAALSDFTATVPEPSAALLAALASVLMSRLRDHRRSKSRTSYRKRVASRLDYCSSSNYVERGTC